MSEVAVTAARRYRIGYAFEPKKVQSFIKTSFIDYANQHSIEFVRIDPAKPLVEQGPFHCIIHKLYGKDWKKQLAEFSAKYPNVAIVDPPELIERLQNRISMLDVVTQLQIPLQNEIIEIPKQVLVDESKASGVANAIEELGLKFPLIAKPVLADGGANSHQLCLVFDLDGLKTLSAPIVLQEFVNHGGVIFKVYVAGQHVNCVKRKSMPDITEKKLRTLVGTLPFYQISNLRVQNDGHTEEDDNAVSNVEKAKLPPRNLVMELAEALSLE